MGTGGAVRREDTLQVIIRKEFFYEDSESERRTLKNRRALKRSERIDSKHITNLLREESSQ